MCFFYGLSEGIDTAGLSRSACKKLPMLDKDNGVGFRVFYQLQCEQQIGLTFRTGFVGDTGPIF